MFTNGELKFKMLKGATSDEKNLWNFLKKTNFNPDDIHPTVVKNSSKGTYETKWGAFFDECVEETKQGFFVNAMIYGSSHGNSFQKDKDQPVVNASTYAVHPKYD